MTHFTKLPLFVLTLLAIPYLQYDYNLTRGRQLWAGMYNAVHYVDHFTFLSDKTPGTHGIFSTFFPVKGGKFWQMDF